MSDVKIICAFCGLASKRKCGHVNRSNKIGANVYCNRICASMARRAKNPRSDEERRASKAEYDRKYLEENAERIKAQKSDWYRKTCDREKERELRKKNMPRHVAYCNRPEYKEWKKRYDIEYTGREYGDFYDVWRLLIELEKEVRSQATAYERRVANGYYLRGAQKRRRELWKSKNLTQAI